MIVPKSPAPAKSPRPVAKRYGDILAKLERLRSLVKEVCRVYIANVERDILEVKDLVDDFRQQSLRKKKVGELVQKLVCS